MYCRRQLVDFDSNAMVFQQENVTVVAASVDTRDVSADLGENLRLRHVTLVAGLDGHAVAEATGAALQTGDRTFLHATGFLVDPDGAIVTSVYSTGPIGRFTAGDVLKKVVFEKRLRERG